MDGPGIIGTLQLAVALAFALPVGLMGATLLADGRLLGAAFLALAAAMLLAERFLTTPEELPFAAAERVTGWLVKEEE